MLKFLNVKILRESITMAMGGSAVLMQLAHPYVAYGIKHHSYTLGMKNTHS